LAKWQSKSGSKSRRSEPASKTVTTSPSKPPKHGGSFSVPYVDARNLAIVGPYIIGNWSVPDALAEALRKSGKAVPKLVSGAMLVDTGADKTCIAEDVAIELGLQAVDRQKVRGAGGLDENTVYAAKLNIAIVRTDGSRSEVLMTIRAVGIPELREHFEANKVNVNGRSLRLIGLLGRDLLRYSKIVYRGETGVVDYTFNFGPLIDQK